jgi:hypothetical protein
MGVRVILVGDRIELGPAAGAIFILVGDVLEVCAGKVRGVVADVLVDNVGEGVTRGIGAGNTWVDEEEGVVLAAGVTAFVVAGFVLIARRAG